MANQLRRIDLINVLRDNNVEFDQEATIVQLRPLYDETIRNLAANNTPLPNDDSDDDEIQRQNVQQQQQRQQQQGQVHSVEQQMPNLHIPPVEHPAERQQPQHMRNQMEQVEIDPQIALLQRRRELLELQREVMQMEGNRYGRFDFRAFESMVNAFTGDDTYDVEKWFIDLENAFMAFQCNDRDKLVAARSLIKGTAKVFLRTIRIASYDELKAELITEFKHAFTTNEVFQ